MQNSIPDQPANGARFTAAFLITVLAYFFAPRHATDDHFSFGTGKFGGLGAFTSAIVLGGVGLVMAGESISRLIHDFTAAEKRESPRRRQ